MELRIHTDGGARGNPGPAAIGIVFTAGDWTHTHERYLGTATNNVAEYTAVKDALELLPGLIKEHGLELSHISFFLDSQLVVCQINGQYKVKEPGLQLLHKEVTASLRQLGIPTSFTHVRRAENAHADTLVNHALDNVQTL